MLLSAEVFTVLHNRGSRCKWTGSDSEPAKRQIDATPFYNSFTPVV